MNSSTSIEPFFPRNAGLVLLGLYALGIVMAGISARIFSWFVKDDDLPFVMELPPYRVPTAKSVFRHTWEKGKQYLQKMAGTILICSIIIWALGYFPHHDGYASAAEQQENSYIGYVGKAIEPVLEPLGFDWKMGVGIIAGVGAKELVVSTLGVMYNVGSEERETALSGDLSGSDIPVAAEAGIDNGPSVHDEEGMRSGSLLPNGGTDTGTVNGVNGQSDASEDQLTLSSVEVDGDTALQRALQRTTTPAAALAYMVFVLLYFPCIATFVAIKNEAGGWKWAVITAVYTILVAWLAAFATYRITLLMSI